MIHGVSGRRRGETKLNGLLVGSFWREIGYLGSC